MWNEYNRLLYCIVLYQVLQDIADNGIKIYQFPDANLDEEDDAANQKLRVWMDGWMIRLMDGQTDKWTDSLLLGYFFLGSHSFCCCWQ